MKDDNTSDDAHQQQQQHPSVLNAAIPWDRVAAFLEFPDMLQVRLTSKEWLWQWHELIGPDVCAAYLSRILTTRNMHLCSDTNEQWTTSTTQSTEQLKQTLLQ